MMIRPDDDVARRLSEAEDIIQALRNQEADAVAGARNTLPLRLRDVEDVLRRQRDSLQLLVDERGKLLEELHRYRDHFEEIVTERTRELRELTHGLMDAQEKERIVIGNELHDEIGQYLTYTTLLIDKASRKPEQQVLDEAKSMVQTAIAQIRDLSAMLSPRLLKSAGLLPALGSLIEDFTQRTNIAVRFEARDDAEDLPEDVALAGYRIVQEALANVARHAQASGVTVQLSRRDGRLRVEVVDNGAGFEPGAVKRSTGLTGMRERAVALGGELTIQSKPGRGAKVVAELPLSRAAAT